MGQLLGVILSPILRKFVVDNNNPFSYKIAETASICKVTLGHKKNNVPSMPNNRKNINRLFMHSSLYFSKLSDKISLFVVGGTYIRCATNNKRESAKIATTLLCISCYEAFQHFFDGFQKSVGRLRKKQGFWALKTQLTTIALFNT